MYQLGSYSYLNIMINLSYTSAIKSQPVSIRELYNDSHFMLWIQVLTYFMTMTYHIFSVLMKMYFGVKIKI